METMRACVRALLVGLMTGLLCPVVSACPIALCRVGATYVNGSAAAGPAAIETITVNLPGEVALEMVWIPGGSFLMGTAVDEKDHEEDEGPFHTVTIEYDFYMGRTEVTQGQWLAVMGSWPDSKQVPTSEYGKGDNYPACFISWHDCQKFIAALNAHVRKSGQGPATFRLPSEAEWEYACRAGTRTSFFWGDETRAKEYMWYEDNNEIKGIKPVGKRLPNGWGFYDMSGNVWEWCQDWYHDSYKGIPSDGSAWEEPAGVYRMARGGDWDNRASVCRSANRNDHRKPGERDQDVGFRLVFTASYTESALRQGLVGAWYHGDDLARIGGGMKIASLDETWGANRGHGNDWSGQWVGFITAPATGKVTFHGESNKEFTVEIAGKTIIHVEGNKGQSSGSVEMAKGEKYPIKVKYLQHTVGTGTFKVLWNWSGQEEALVPADVLGFNAEQEEFWNYIERPDPSVFDFGTLKTIPVENHFAYSEPGRFGGWPANNGVWIWGNEIVVGLEQGYHDPQPGGGHAIRRDMPQLNVLSRSLDGGKTWKIEDPDNFVGDDGRAKECLGVNFAHPDFAMRVRGSRFFVSYDRGRTWEGPYRVNITGKKVGRLTSRTDYIVLGPKECLVFMSAETGLVESNYQDRAFCARTTDGGKSFEFEGWMTHDVEARSVMPSTVYVGDRHLVSVMRRKHEQKFEGRPSITRNWIEAVESKDDGRTWVNLGKVADTDLGDRNGNPPAMIRLKDGRLCVAYGYRAYPYGIRVKLSSDNGRTWGDEIVLRHDGATWDLGYPRMVERPDGKVVTIYYFNTKEVPAQHIGATIWDPADVK